MVDFVRSAATEKLVRPLGVEPLGVDGELGLHHVDVKRQDKSAGEFVLEIAVEPFDYGDASVFSDGTVAVPDVRKAPVAEVVTVELLAPVSHDVSGRAAQSNDQPGEYGTRLLGRRLVLEDRELVDFAGVVVLDRHYPVAEGESLGQGEWHPGSAEATDKRDQGEVDAPDVIGSVGFDGLRFRFVLSGGLDLGCGFRSGHGLFLEDIPGSGHGHGESCPSQCGDDLLCAQARAESLEPLYEVADVDREPVHGFSGAEQRVWAVLVATFDPASDSVFRYQQVLGGLWGVPAPSGHEFEDLQSLHRMVAGTFVTRHSSEANQQESQLLSQQMDFLVTPVDLSPVADAWQRTVAADSTGAGDRRVGQCDGLQDSRLDVGAPGTRQRDVFKGGRDRHMLFLERVSVSKYYYYIDTPVCHKSSSGRSA